MLSAQRVLSLLHNTDIVQTPINSKKEGTVELSPKPSLCYETASCMYGMLSDCRLLLNVTFNRDMEAGRKLSGLAMFKKLKQTLNFVCLFEPPFELANVFGA